LTVNLRLDGCVELTRHIAHCEFGREGQSRVLRVGRILKADGLESNEVLVVVGPYSGIGSELDRRDLGYIYVGCDCL